MRLRSWSYRMEFFLLNVLPQIGTFLIGAMYIPQIVKTYKTKDVSGMAVSFWIMLVLALSVLTINATVVFITFGTFGFLITEIINLSLAVVVLIQIMMYKKRKLDVDEKI